MQKRGNVKMNFVQNTIKYFRVLFEESSSKLLQSVLILVIGWWIVNKVCKIATIFFQKGISDKGIISFLNSIIKFSLRLVLLLIVMATLGMDVTSLMAAVAASLVAIGIALKDNISNLVSGIILVVSKPIHVGDLIEFDGVKGKVLKIEMMFTTLKSDADNELVIAPNSKLVSNNIKRVSEYNMTKVEKSYTSSSNCDKIKEMKLLFQKELILNKKIMSMPAPEVKLVPDQNGFSLYVRIWTQNKYKEVIGQDIDKIVKKIFSKYNLELI